jgi:hypothetical protein
MPVFARNPRHSLARVIRVASLIAVPALMLAAVAAAAPVASAAPSASASPPSHTIAGAPALAFGSEQTGGGAAVDFWRMKLVGGDQVSFSVSYPVDNYYEFDMYAPGVTDTTFPQATPVASAVTNSGTDTGVISLHAPRAGNFILAVCEDPASNCTSSAFGNSTSPMSPYTFTPRFFKGPGTAVTLRLSAAKIAYGSEKSLRLSVKVTSQFAGPLAGTVTLRAGRKTICSARLSAKGQGSCSPSSGKLLAVGTYSVTAAFGGTPSFPPSTSKAAKLTITKKR